MGWLSKGAAFVGGGAVNQELSEGGRVSFFTEITVRRPLFVRLLGHEPRVWDRALQKNASRKGRVARSLNRRRARKSRRIEGSTLWT